MSGALKYLSEKHAHRSKKKCVKQKKKYRQGGRITFFLKAVVKMLTVCTEGVFLFYQAPKHGGKKVVKRHGEKQERKKRKARSGKCEKRQRIADKERTRVTKKASRGKHTHR